MIFQDPMTALNPTLTVGDQLAEALLEHRPVSKTDARKAVISMLELVADPESERAFEAVSAPIQRRDEAADRNRHGAHLRTGDFDCG